MLGLPEMIGLVKVLLVRVCVASLIVTVPDTLGRVIVLSAVGSSTVKVVSKSSTTAPSKTMLAPARGVPVKVGLEIVGEVRVLLVRVWVLFVPTTLDVFPIPCTSVIAVMWLLASRKSLPIAIWRMTAPAE